MTPKSKKICLLLAGGTAITEKDILGSSVNKKEDIEKWLGQVPEIILMAQIEPVFVCAQGKLKGASLWQKLSQQIYEQRDVFDGFVIVLDVESVLYSGIALSLALENFTKPIILTASQITKETVKLDDWQTKKTKAYGGLGIKANLINAVQIATMALPATALMFGNRIIRAVKAKRSQALGLNIFASVDEKYLGRIDFGISLTEKFKLPQGSVKLKNNFETRIKSIDYFPGMDLEELNDEKVKGKIIRGLPNFSLLASYKGQSPVVVHNRFLISSPKASNVFLVNNMTWEMALIKFMWLLGQEFSAKEVGKMMSEETCGEFISER